MTKRSRTNPTLRALAQIDLFRSCNADQLAPLLPNADVIDVAVGTVIAEAGTAAQQFVGIVDGYVEALDEHGRMTVVGPGEQIGARELVDDRAHSVTVIARTAATLVVVFGPAFRWAAGDLGVAAALEGPTPSPASPELTSVY
jgi:CRP-like cAMP-binding protein